ncbi:HNH endonuclease [Pontibacter sp. BT731]|uniref:HNH endonuclease n=1 Tax=Pontibacter coccineus TaxID=3063328 RepID=UPI0026E41D0B|nr:HNH endonuclease [Pontibacter sp. BT731]MDO6389001.1 HNH endonuclease [Pontibacter sp. BT731]
MKEIQLTRGFKALVNDADFEELNKYRWHTLKGTNTHYAVRSIRTGPLKTKIYMHKQIMGTQKGEYVDHIDRNGLNCQRDNLRVCTKAQNAFNSRTFGAIKYRGVSKHNDKYRAQIFTGGQRRHLGLYPTAEAAALAYNDVARELHGEYANLNIV